MKEDKANRGAYVRRWLVCWGPLVLVVGAFLLAVILRNNVMEVAEDSREMAATTVHITSLDSLKTIIATLSNQYVHAEQSWSNALSTNLLLFFMVSVIAIILSVRLLLLDKEITDLKKRQAERN